MLRRSGARRRRADERQKFDELVEDQGTKMDFVQDRLKCAPLPRVLCMEFLRASCVDWWRVAQHARQCCMPRARDMGTVMRPVGMRALSVSAVGRQAVQGISGARACVEEVWECEREVG